MERDRKDVNSMVDDSHENIASVSICDVDDCNNPAENETDAGDLCEKHYDEYFQALDNASRC